MDFWASLEHKIYYKYNKSIPEHLRNELTEAASSANALDQKMERLHNKVNVIKENETEPEADDLTLMELNDEKLHLPMNVLNSFIDKNL